ncbi:hypothetical protein [Sphingomonas sp.]|uniref:hypothetical protein n=1 Tax=Sphingomonas sp. TaxID=28214 RepID=UPI003D6D8987
MDKTWNNPVALDFYKGMYDSDRFDGKVVRQVGTAGSALNFSAGFRTQLLGKSNPLPWIIGGISFVGGRAGSYFEAKAQGYIDGINARLKEMRAESDGTCPKYK